MSAAQEIGTPEPEQDLGLAKYSTVIAAKHAELLRWYFRNGGLEMFAHSPTAALLERARMFSYTATPCLTCGGDEARWQGGSGFVHTTAKRRTTDEQRAMLALLDLKLDDDGLLPPAGDLVCRECEGRGWRLPKRYTHSREPITARPTGSSKRGYGAACATVSDADMDDLGKVTTWLARTAGLWAPARAALETYYAPDGGNLNALWALVPAGKTMLRTNPQRLPPTQLFQNLRNQQAEKPTDKRRAQFAAADEQAAELLAAVGTVWNQAVGND
jgi:hypothetical protein